MSLKSQFKSSAAAMVDGVWFRNFEKNADGTQPGFLLARMSPGNPGYNKAMQDAATQLQQKGASQSEDDAMMTGLLADYIVKSWEHIQPNDDGQNLPFNRENVVKLLGDPEWIDLRIEIRRRATDLSGFKAKELDGSIKN